MKSNARCTIVVITYNRRARLAETLECLSRLPERLPIIVVDNGSRDGTGAFVRDAWPDVRVIDLETNVGAAGRNAGARAATTDYVAFCDDDCWWEPGALSRGIDLLDAFERVVLLHASVVVNGDALDPACELMARSRVPKHTGCPGRAIAQFMGCAVLVRRAAFLDAGGYDPRFFIGAEESLLALDFLDRGWDMMYVPSLVAHHAPATEGRDHFARRTHVHRNRLWTTWLRRSPRYVVSATLNALVACFRDAAARAAVRPAIRGLPWIVRERRVVRPDVERLMDGLTELPP